ncbi:MAG TPA: radical SAM protein [Gammaproteobacteria bacterium]|nr:radical SAM protein [Gammaproteobacteria bacterium]
MTIPLSLYIHIPWCVKKCPYCDFNSHALQNVLPETMYLDALVQDLKLDLHHVQNRKINTIFFGGGTPSLISPAGFERLLDQVSQHVCFADDIEITMEANPGTVEHFNFADYKQAGINRISLGAQSFEIINYKHLEESTNQMKHYAQLIRYIK